MVKSKGYKDKDGETKTLRDCVEMYALMICEDIENGEGIERTLQKCKALDSIVGALTAISNQDA